MANIKRNVDSWIKNTEKQEHIMKMLTYAKFE